MQLTGMTILLACQCSGILYGALSMTYTRCDLLVASSKQSTVNADVNACLAQGLIVSNEQKLCDIALAV